MKITHWGLLTVAAITLVTVAACGQGGGSAAAHSASRPAVISSPSPVVTVTTTPAPSPQPIPLGVWATQYATADFAGLEQAARDMGSNLNSHPSAEQAASIVNEQVSNLNAAVSAAQSHPVAEATAQRLYDVVLQAYSDEADAYWLVAVDFTAEPGNSDLINADVDHVVQMRERAATQMRQLHAYLASIHVTVA